MGYNTETLIIAYQTWSWLLKLKSLCCCCRRRYNVAVVAVVVVTGTTASVVATSVDVVAATALFKTPLLLSVPVLSFVYRSLLSSLDQQPVIESVYSCLVPCPKVSYDVVCLSLQITEAPRLVFVEVRGGGSFYSWDVGGDGLWQARSRGADGGGDVRGGLMWRTMSWCSGEDEEQRALGVNGEDVMFIEGGCHGTRTLPFIVLTPMIFH